MVHSLSRWSATAGSRPWIRVAAALLPLATCLILATVRDQVTGETAVLILVVWVVAAAATGDRIAGVVAALSGGVWFDFFLTQPYQAFAIEDPDNIEATVLLVVISLVVTEVALWGYRQQREAARQAGYLDGLVTVAASIAEGHTPPNVVNRVVADQITDVLGADESRYVSGLVHDPRIALLDHDGLIRRGDQTIDVDRVGLPTDGYVAVPVHHQHQTVAHFLVTAATLVSRPTREQRRVAALLADQAGFASAGTKAAEGPPDSE